jgi:hypothetical protein
MSKEPSAFVFVVLCDEKTETSSWITGIYNTYPKALEAIMEAHPESVCIDDAEFIGTLQTGHLFEYNTFLYSIHQRIIQGYLPSSA